MHTTTHAESKAADELVAQYCRMAFLGEVQTLIMRRYLCEGARPAEIAFDLPVKKGAKPMHTPQVRKLIDNGLQRICKVPGARHMLQATVSPAQFSRLVSDEDRPATLNELMSGPAPSQRRTPEISDQWTEVCFLPGAPKREQVAVQMSSTMPRWWSR